MGHQSSSVEDFEDEFGEEPCRAALSSSPMCRSSSSGKGLLREEVCGLSSSNGSSKDWEACQHTILRPGSSCR